MVKIRRVIFSFLIISLIASCLFTSFAAEDIKIDANAAIMVEVNTGKVIYEMDKEEQNFPASVTKILTAIVTIENCKLDDVAVATEKALSNIPSAYVTAPLFTGEEMRVEDLLYALMLKSANDAAYVLAEHVGGSNEGFSDMMNKKAKEIGCKNTHFVNPNGIHNEEHFTTAYDMYLISKYAMENETFRKIVSTNEYTLPVTNKYKQEDRIMKNTNYFLNPNSKFYNEYVNGIKTGTTNQAGNCLVTDCSKDGLDIITVVLGAKTSDSKFTETEKLLKYAFENYTLTEMHKQKDLIKTVEVNKAKKNMKELNLIIDSDITVLNNIETKKDDIEPVVKINEEITAPIEEGQELGTITYNVEGIEYSAKLLAANSVEKRTYEKEIAIGILILFFLLILIRKINIARRRNRKRRR